MRSAPVLDANEFEGLWKSAPQDVEAALFADSSADGVE